MVFLLDIIETQFVYQRATDVWELWLFWNNFLKNEWESIKICLSSAREKLDVGHLFRKCFLLYPIVSTDGKERHQVNECAFTNRRGRIRLVAIRPSMIVLSIATHPLPLVHKMDLGKETWQPKVLAAAAGQVCAVTLSAGSVDPVERDLLVFSGRRNLSVTPECLQHSVPCISPGVKHWCGWRAARPSCSLWLRGHTSESCNTKRRAEGSAQRKICIKLLVLHEKFQLGNLLPLT